MSVISKDFVVKSGLVIRGTATVTTATQATIGGAYFAGGVAVNKNVMVQGNTTIHGDTGEALTVLAKSTFQDINAQQFTATSITANGPVEITGANTFSVGTGQSTLSGPLNVTGQSTFTSATFDGNVDVSGTYTFTVGTGKTTLGGQLEVTDTSVSTSTFTGALIVAGGVGIGGDLYIAGEIVAQKLTIELTTVTTTEVTTDDIISTQNLTNAINTQSGAIQAAGGLGLGRDIYVGGNATILGSTTVTSISNSFSTESGALVVTGGVGIGQDLWVGGNIYGSATSATNLTGGAPGSLPYQSDTGTTAFIAIGTNGYVLSSNGAVPTWSPVSGLSAGNATTASNLAGGWANAIPYQNATGSTVFNGNLEFNGTRFKTIKVEITGTDVTTNTDTGALTVDGGVGIDGSVFIGQALTVIGQTTLAALTATISTVTSLTVYGLSTLGNVSAATITGTSITVTGNGTLDVGTGTTTLGGTLNVTGQSSLGPLTAGLTTATTLNVNGLITSGITQAQTTGSVVPALFSNNVLLSSFTSNSISGTGTVNLDTFTASEYRSVRYFIQIYDNPLVQITEMTVFHDSTDVFIIEYGTGASSGELGSFSATLGGGTVTLTFTPSPSATDMRIKIVRMALTS